MKISAAFLPRSGFGRIVAATVAACVCAILLAYGWDKIRPPAAKKTPFTPEQTYYQQLIYAVNEMHNQLAQMNGLRLQGKPAEAPDKLDRQTAYADSLMPATDSPPEELTVALSLAQDLQRSYRQYAAAVKTGDSSQADAAYRQSESEYRKFQQNGDLILILSAYNGVNLYCH
ncbi:hypothetical protein [Cohnella caldifontis]|uniref:hypothetical protein n=1 Tax=Cohnella caldifontis TaxID=3027471 RepID=UPI0023ECC64F|nr:hypothetical protein [Cohnella sp. YIM B05605]